MQHLLDTLASGIHDAKNQLFIAESLIAASEAKHGLDLGEARYAIEAAAGRLSRTLSAYRLMRRGAQLAIVPCIVDDLCREVALAQKQHLALAGITLDIDCQVIDEWPLDRDLITDMLNNAVQNAGRFARSRVVLSARTTADGICASKTTAPVLPNCRRGVAPACSSLNAWPNCTSGMEERAGCNWVTTAHWLAPVSN